ncbi:MAG: hypothetical protein LBI85_02515 [Spirochaetaceae bacterium]|jgi:hypothetical protein|nr:hypothetical protein [Spirochaetaceae bacterium]
MTYSKRNIIGVLAGVLCCLAFAGCVGTTALGVLDESIPESEQCPLELRNNLAVVIYDNQPVEWGPDRLTANKASISIPPGDHTFVIRYYQTRNYGGMNETTAETATITQEFLPGHSYRIYQSKIWLLFITISSIKCKDVTPRNKR